MFGNPRYSFEAGDTIRLDGRCGRVLAAVSPGVLVEWWDDSRGWVEMSKLDNLSTGRPAVEIPAENPPPVVGTNTTMDPPRSPISPELAQANADLRRIVHGG